MRSGAEIGKQSNNFGSIIAVTKINNDEDDTPPNEQE